MIYGRCSRLRAASLNRAQPVHSPSNRCGSMDTAITFAGQIQSWLADLGDGGWVEDERRGELQIVLQSSGYAWSLHSCLF